MVLSDRQGKKDSVKSETGHEAAHVVDRENKDEGWPTLQEDIIGNDNGKEEDEQSMQDTVRKVNALDSHGRNTKLFKEV